MHSDADAVPNVVLIPGMNTVKTQPTNKDKTTSQTQPGETMAEHRTEQNDDVGGRRCAPRIERNTHAHAHVFAYAYAFVFTDANDKRENQTEEGER